jgi:hypothetical protein
MNENKKRLTASERESLMRLNVAREILTTEPNGYLKERSKLVPGARRDMAMMAAKIRKMMPGFEATIPADQMMTYLRNLHSASYMIGMRRPGKQHLDEVNYGIWLPYEVLNALLAGCHDHCMMCNADIVGQKRCRLRKALATIPNDSEERSDGGCPYFELM